VSCGATPPGEHAATDTNAVAPALATDTVPNDPDDPAIWISPTRPETSLILATDKIEVIGGLYVFGLDGRLRQSIAPLDRPNNVDVEYGYLLGGAPTDIAVVTERMKRRLRVFAIPPNGGPLVDLAPDGLPVLEGAAGEAGEPMGIALYKRPRDGAIFAIVAPKTGGASEYLWQYRLDSVGSAVRLAFVRRFGQFSGVGPHPEEAGEIEAVVVDDELGYVYYSDERFGIRKWHADPEAADASIELAAFGTDGYQGDREGLAIYRRGNGTGYLVSSDQLPGGTRLHVYPRNGAAGAPHRHDRLAIITTSSDQTDGLDVSETALPGFPQGVLVMMNSASRNFLVYRWEDIAARLRP
jgi:3-phytase